MALSVKTFDHPVDCPQPSNYVTVNYHATSADELCAGNGSLYQIWGNYSSLSDIFANSDSSTGSNTDLCANGMDVVFCVDYTSSMGGEINDVKTGIADIVNTIATESGEDYRLGLVIFDEYSVSGTINYQNTSTYTSLPNAQKIDTTQNNTRTVITCLEKMGVVGDSTSFSTELAKLNTSDLPLGSGSAGPEPGGLAGNEIIGGFAGGWRSDALKMVILITDASAGGDDDIANAADTTFFNNTLIPNANNNGVQFLIQTNFNSNGGDQNYANLASNTIPQGIYDNQVNFANSNWPSVTLIPYIEQLCDETFTYNCDPAPAGWYQEVGSNTVYYWDGTNWTQEEICEFTVTVSIVDNISNGTVDQIGTGHPNYGGNSSTFEFTGPVGTAISQVWDADPNTYYNNLVISGAQITTVSGNGNLTTATRNGNNADAADITLSNEEFKFSGSIIGDASYTLVISGSASAIQYRHSVIIKSDIYDTDGSTAGQMYFDSEQSGWTASTYFNSTHNQNLAVYTKDFIGVYNSAQSWGQVDFLPNPSNYDLVLDNSYSVAYSDPTTATAIANNGTVNYNHVGENMSGTFDMPPTFGSTTYTISGQSNQPQYTTQLNVTELITGASFAPTYNQVSYTGYTGDTTTISIPFDLDPGYGDVDINPATQVIVTGLAANALVSNVAFNTTTNTLSFDLEIGTSNIAGNMEISGSATQIRYTYTVDFVTVGMGGLTYPTTNLLGEMNTTPSATVGAQNIQPDTVYQIDGVSSDEGDLDASAANSGLLSLDIDIDLVGGMPIGGGSATVTVTGSADATQYD